MCVKFNAVKLKSSIKKIQNMGSRVARRRPGSLGFNTIWASMRETLTLLLVSNKGADQPAHPHSLISAFVTPYLKSKVIIILHFCGLQHDKASGYAPDGQIWNLSLSVKLKYNNDDIQNVGPVFCEN